MKTCPTCGSEADDRFLFCPDDGTDLARNQACDESPINDVSGNDSARKLSVLFCPACEGEYPLTFSMCPIDGLRLTRERVRFRRPGRPAFDTHIIEDIASVSIPAARVNHERSRSEPADVETIPESFGSAHYESIDDNVEETGKDYDHPAVGHEAPAGLIERIKNDRPSFRIAAIATMIGLALFGLTAVYRLYTYGVRKPAPATLAGATETPQERQPSFFIDTPREARDYVDESAASEESESTSQPPATEMTGPVPAASIDNREQADRKMQKTQALPARKSGVSPSTMAPPPVQRRTDRAAEGGVDVRLVRMRASRSQSGYRYDLTYNMREVGGRQVRWDKLTISARSSSGLNHLQALPFNHQLNASRVITFTVSLEMTGLNEPDWRGRLVCTTVGTDNLGRPVRATFGASVAP